MHSILWASILASAGVAIVTTLLVEYFAKPSLEARKDRILEEKRRRRQAIRNIKRAAGLATHLDEYTSDGLWRGKTKRAERLREEINKTAEEMDGLVKSAYEVMEVPESMENEWTDTAAYISGFSSRIRAGENPPDEAWDDFEKATALLWAFAGFAERSRVWRRPKTFEIIKSYHLSRNKHEARGEDNSLPE